MDKKEELSFNHYRLRFIKVLGYIDDNLGQDITLENLAEVANFSKYHFTRLFTAVFKETPFEFIKRLRLEKASVLLKLQIQAKISDISRQCGFNDQVIFSRAFKMHFKCSATQWRKLNLKQSNKSQIRDNSLRYFCPELKLSNMEQLIKSEIEQLPDLTVAYIRHIGPYSKMEGIYQELFDKLYKWVEDNLFNNSFEKKAVVIHHDDPTITPESKQRTSICLTIPNETKITSGIGKMIIPGGKHLVAEFNLEIDEIGDAWDWIYSNWFPTSNYQPGDNPPYQWYINKPIGKRLSVKFCVPIKPL